jgi:transcriptional regulator with XRE-family HTH domain
MVARSRRGLYHAAVTQHAHLDPAAVRTELPHRLRRIRQLSGWKQADLAAAMGVSAPTLSLYEKGLFEPKFCAVLGLLAALGLPVSVLTDAELDARAIRRAALAGQIMRLERERALLLGPSRPTPQEPTAPLRALPRGSTPHGSALRGGRQARGAAIPAAESPHGSVWAA